MTTVFRTLSTLGAISFAILLILGCGESSPPSVGRTSLSVSDVGVGNTLTATSNRSHASVPASLSFVVPEHVATIFKRKCYVCHGGDEVEGGFNLREMVYRPEPEADWQPMDLNGATRIKLAILPVNGEPARMPKRAGSIWNPLTVDEANGVAAWTDYPFAR